MISHRDRHCGDDIKGRTLGGGVAKGGLSWEEPFQLRPKSYWKTRGEGVLGGGAARAKTMRQGQKWCAQRS